MEKNDEVYFDNLSYLELSNILAKPGQALESQDGKYGAFINPKTKNFITIALQIPGSKLKTEEGKIFAKYGLKFHVSLLEDDEISFSKGWDIVKSILMDYNVTAFKIIRPIIKMSDDLEQAGKTITIYADKNLEKGLDEWHGILKRITKELTKAKIPPGHRPVGTKDRPEKPIKGSNYITYRYHDEKKNLSIWPEYDPCELGFGGRAPLEIYNVMNQISIPLPKNVN